MTDREELIEAVKTVREFCLSHSGRRGILMCHLCVLHDFCENAPESQAYVTLAKFCNALIGRIEQEEY